MATIKFYDRNDHCVAVIRVPMPGGGGAMSVAGVGDSKADALARAASIAHRIMEDPVMSALMPPQAKAAIVAARGLAAAAKRGKRVLKSFWRRLKGPGKKRLARALLDEVKKQNTADVGWNPFRRKRKRPARGRITASSRRPVTPPPRMRPMPEQPMPEQYDEGVDSEQYNEQHFDDGAAS